MINKNGLKADPEWTSTVTENELDSYPSTAAAVLQPL